MDKSNKMNLYRGLVKAGYKDSFLEALASFQAIEDLLKACIRTSNYILNKSSHIHITYSPDNSSLERAGLGMLANKFKALTTNKTLCDEIKKLSEKRNLLAHKELVPILKLSFTDEQINNLQHCTVDITDIADSSRKLYLELGGEYQKLLSVKAEIDSGSEGGESP